MSGGGRKVMDLAGKDYNFIHVIGLVYTHNKNSYWKCKCLKCGIIWIKGGNAIKTGIACRHCALVMGKKGKFMDYPREYSIWNHLVHRCTDPKNKAWQWYGGRGIGVSDEWRYDFLQFIKDMGKVPIGYSIERVDNNKGYCKENCKWIPRGEQARNRRSNRLITLKGETKLLHDWLRELNIPYATWKYRVKRRQMTESEALTVWRYHPKRRTLIDPEVLSTEGTYQTPKN